ncbi:NifB/NifX family molybdenum-iron cluster-binding protein [Geobacter sp. SVR]|uniref:NifB/NifX family molybdenum-iron cluster-binding protein n=1 Tax=Geobacter sp. SVR TaxID=2495594 RepID=UPI00143EFD26|nr:NifB/NifX family molybdenum-iron cluster-binding protein [Geobacter sp. SVR]BCS52511.1 nitrogen fixation protein NifX [Geobacter sp. SVR]GCF84052.1 nitrogen fixation protein NifX [Geobacter sp. SVR]
MKVAFTTSTGATIDGNFRTSGSFSVWDIGTHESYYVTSVHVGTEAGSEDDRIAARAEALKECTMVFATQISGPAAAKLIAHNVHPQKTNGWVSVEEVIHRLQEVLRSAPPPWMRKAMLPDFGADGTDSVTGNHGDRPTALGNFIGLLDLIGMPVLT